jgi:hypothetical protein
MKSRLLSEGGGRDPSQHQRDGERKHRHRGQNGRGKEIERRIGKREREQGVVNASRVGTGRLGLIEKKYILYIYTECLWKIFRPLDFFHILLGYRHILK